MQVGEKLGEKLVIHRLFLVQVVRRRSHANRQNTNLFFGLFENHRLRSSLLDDLQLRDSGLDLNVPCVLGSMFAVFTE
jgi:hypothetical protein